MKKTDSDHLQNDLIYKVLLYKNPYLHGCICLFLEFVRAERCYKLNQLYNRLLVLFQNI